jgi:uroporphyrinogen decarboxylase
MTPRETILSALDGRKTDRVPVALVGGGMWTTYHYGVTFEDISHDPEQMSRMLFEMAGRILSDIVYVGSGFPNFPVAALGGAIKYRDVGAPDLEVPIVSAPEELDLLDPTLIDSHPVIQTLRTALALTRSRIGREFLVTLTAWGPFTLGARIIGEEAMMKALYRNTRFVESVCRFAGDLLLRFFRPALEAGMLEVILIGEPTASGDLISRRQFEAFVLPHLRSFTDAVKAYGCRTIVHICGNTSDRFDLFPLTGASCMSIDHKADIAQAAEVLCGKMCLAGNADPVRVLLQEDAAEVEATCRRIIESAGTVGGFILMPGCDIPPTVPLENLRAFVRAAREWQNV